MDEMNYWLEINNFKVTLELEEAIYCNVDDEGLKQVLSNLITNAIKYSTLNKHIIIRAYTNSSKAYIEVTDHGIGIQKDKQESIFKKFYRIQEQGQHKAGGTGLGLTVSKDIVEAMGGTLTVESELNQGSTFRITLNISVEK